MGSLAELLGLLAIVAVIGYWASAMRCQETARQAGGLVCRQHDVQLLDDTVALRRLRLQRDARGRLAVWREYRFDFSVDGHIRHSGSVILLGGRVKHAGLDGNDGPAPSVPRH